MAAEAVGAELAAIRARIVSTAEAWQLVRAAAAVWARAAVDEQQAMARALGAALGGISVTIQGAIELGNASNASQTSQLEARFGFTFACALGRR